MQRSTSRARVDDSIHQEYRTSPRGLLDMILRYTREGFDQLGPQERELESHRCYRLLPEHRRRHLGNMSRMLRHRPSDSITPRELALIRLSWEFAFRNNPTLRPQPPVSTPIRGRPMIPRPVPYERLPARLQAIVRPPVIRQPTSAASSAPQEVPVPPQPTTPASAKPNIEQQMELEVLLQPEAVVQPAAETELRPTSDPNVPPQAAAAVDASTGPAITSQAIAEARVPGRGHGRRVFYGQFCGYLP